MIWWFLILGLSTLAVVGAAIAMYMRVRRHMKGAGTETGESTLPDEDHHLPRHDT
jgi:hypothetical protein